MAERRQWPRLPLKFNVQFFTEEEGQRDGSGTGTTIDVSAGGMYYVTPNWERMSLGQDLRLRLSGLSAHDSGPLFRSLSAKARVVRMVLPEEKDAACVQVGVAVRFHEAPRFAPHRFLEHDSRERAEG